MTISAAGRARRSRLRGIAAILILGAWSAALVGLVRRDVVRTPVQRMADIALRVNPGNVFFAVEQDGRHIGWASSTIDTLTDTLVVRDAFTADVSSGGVSQRAITRTQVVMSRRFVLRGFTAEAGTAAAPTRVSGHVEGDTAIVYTVENGTTPGTPQRVRVNGPVLVPSLVPLAAMLGEKPKVGRAFSYTTFDPSTMASRAVSVAIQAESLFVVDDSARKDLATGRWVSALRDTVRAWKLGAPDGQPMPGVTGWVDAQGRMVETTALSGVRLHRMAYELSFENWRLAGADSGRATGRAPSSDIRATSAIAANITLPAAGLSSLRVRLTAPSLTGLDLRGGRQSIDGDVLTITREPDSVLTPAYTLPASFEHRMRFSAELRNEPGIETFAPVIVALAVHITGPARTDPRAATARLVRWLHDSLQKVPTLSVPDAVEVLMSRRGDCNEHTQLFTALARTLGIPTRIAAGLAYVNGTFYYHAWPEVYLGDWVAVDPTFGQFPADAAHVRLVTGGLARQTELLGLVGTLHIDVLEAR